MAGFREQADIPFRTTQLLVLRGLSPGKEGDRCRDSFALVLTLQYALVAAGVAQSNAPRELHKPIEKRDLPAQTLLWFSLVSCSGRQCPFTPRSSVTGRSLPRGRSPSRWQESPLPLSLRSCSEQELPSLFVEVRYVCLDTARQERRLDAQLSISPLGDKTAYRYENVAEKAGNALSQDVEWYAGHSACHV